MCGTYPSGTYPLHEPPRPPPRSPHTSQQLLEYLGLYCPPRGASTYDVRTEGERGDRVKKSQNVCGRHIWKPPINAVIVHHRPRILILWEDMWLCGLAHLRELVRPRVCLWKRCIPIAPHHAFTIQSYRQCQEASALKLTRETDFGKTTDDQTDSKQESERTSKQAGQKNRKNKNMVLLSIAFHSLASLLQSCVAGQP